LGAMKHFSPQLGNLSSTGSTNAILIDLGLQIYDFSKKHNLISCLSFKRKHPTRNPLGLEKDGIKELWHLSLSAFRRRTVRIEVFRT
jgi:hypothetical protein